MNLLPWRKQSTELVPVEKKKTELAPRKGELANVMPEDNPPLAPIVVHGMTVLVRPKSVMISGKKHEIDPYQLMRMIKRVTQTIGEYNKVDGPYAAYIVTALRKARGDMVSDLEHHFRIHWQIDQNTGQSVFYM